MGWLMKYPEGSTPEFKTKSRNYILDLAEIWEVVHCDDSWIDKPFYVDGKFFESRAEYRDFYKEQHQKHFK